MSDPSPLNWFLAGLSALIVLIWICAHAWSKKSRSIIARKRAAVALAGERNAEAWLRKLGYRIDAHQVCGAIQITVDGAPIEYALRADFIVSRAGKRYVAEVKTGAHATSLQAQATRRQLLEYLVAFAADGLLLMDMHRKKIHTVQFSQLQFPQSLRPNYRTICFLLGLVLGALATALCKR